MARTLAGFALDLGRVLVVLPVVEKGRKQGSPAPLLAAMRLRGNQAPKRSAAARARLARAIRWVDRLGPGGPNCLRRTLLRVALDPDAAKEPVVLGLNVSAVRGGARSEATGHAWVEEAEPAGRYEVEFRI
jgi:hypothetical protein